MAAERRSKTKTKHVQHSRAKPKQSEDNAGKNIKELKTPLNSSTVKFIWKFLFFILLTILVFYYVSRSQNHENVDKVTDNEDVKNLQANATQEKKYQEVTKDLPQDEKPTENPEFSASSLSEIVLPESLTYSGHNFRIKELKHKNKKSSVRIYVIDDFLTKDECDGLSAAHIRHVNEWSETDPLLCFSGLQTFRKYLKEAGLKIRVSESDFTQGTSCVNETFSLKLKGKLSWSFSTAFYPIESKFSQIYEERIEAVTGLLKTHGGKFQITSYPENVGYKSHTDCSMNYSELRDRYATTLVYLQDVRKGGETIFTNLEISVQPKQGRLLVWNNMNKKGECDPTSVHQAASVRAGRKYILQRWYYFKNFPSLGIRIAEPELPRRKEMQPRVSCDQFEEGSCRWYDEWGYDHLKEYKYNT